MSQVQDPDPERSDGERERRPVVADNAGALAQFVRRIRLVWRLMLDSRVPTWPKLVVPATLLYILSPIDLIPDLILGLGQIDDVAIFFFGISLFVELCPRDIVEEHRRALANPTADRSTEEVIEGTYRVTSDDDSDN